MFCRRVGKPTRSLPQLSALDRSIRGGARPRLVDAAAEELGRVLDAREDHAEHDQRQTDAQGGRRLVEFGRRLDRLKNLRQIRKQECRDDAIYTNMPHKENIQNTNKKL